jgi:glycosyltransferase involved in cell wall biosynthesis
MRVLLANSEGGLRGGELQTVALATGLRELGCEVALAARREGALLSSASASLRCEPFRFEPVPVSTPFALASLIARWKPDVLHAQTSTAHTHLWLARRLLRGAPPLVVSRRVAFPVARDVLSLLKYRTGVAHYIPISNAALRSLAALGIPASMMTVVPSGVDTARFRNARGNDHLRGEWGIGSGEMIIGMVGAFEEEKGHRVLLDAAPLVLEAYAEARFVLIGAGRTLPAIERLIARSNLAGKVLCFEQRAPLETILPLFGVFVLPSLDEGLSSAVLAAMATGLPIVASNVGGIPEAVTPECGILVPPGEAAPLAEAILQLIRDEPLRERLGAAARERASSFDASIMVRKTCEIYRRVVGRGDTRSKP